MVWIQSGFDTLDSTELPLASFLGTSMVLSKLITYLLLQVHLSTDNLTSLLFLPLFLCQACLNYSPINWKECSTSSVFIYLYLLKLPDNSSQDPYTIFNIQLDFLVPKGKMRPLLASFLSISLLKKCIGKGSIISTLCLENKGSGRHWQETNSRVKGNTMRTQCYYLPYLFISRYFTLSTSSNLNCHGRSFGDHMELYTIESSPWMVQRHLRSYLKNWNIPANNLTSSHILNTAEHPAILKLFPLEGT